MKKYIIVLFSIFLLFSPSFHVKADTTNALETKRAKVLDAEIKIVDTNFIADKTPRIINFYGLPGLYVDTSTGNWKEDPAGALFVKDGRDILQYVRPIDIDYCKKWYPKTTAVEPYQIENIKKIGKTESEQRAYDSPTFSTQCLETLPQITLSTLPRGILLTKGKQESIIWNDHTVAYEKSGNERYDINLISYYPPCGNSKCSRPEIKSFVIAKKVFNGGYNWEVGQVKISGSNNEMKVPNGKYLIQVCKTGTDICDISNNPFEIITTPIISQISGFNEINVNQSYEWTVKASNLDGGKLTYFVDWGDSANAICVSKIYCPIEKRLPQSPIFTHSFSKEGTYNVTFTVVDANGQSAKEGLTIYVSGPSSYSDITVLSPNNGILLKGNNQKIDWADKTNNLHEYYDISLVDTKGEKINDHTMAYWVPFTIAKKVSGYSYDWKIGSLKDLESNENFTMPDGSYNLKVNEVIVPDGKSNAGTNAVDIIDGYYYPYVIKICRTDTDVCDYSDTQLTLVTNCSFDDQNECNNPLAFDLNSSNPMNLNFDWETRVGKTGDDIKMIQRVLKNESLYTGKINGFYDSKTQIAVKKYYKKHNITKSLWMN